LIVLSFVDDVKTESLLRTRGTKGVIYYHRLQSLILARNVKNNHISF